MTNLNINSFARIELFALGEKIIKESDLDIVIDKDHCVVLPIITIMKVFGPHISQLYDSNLFNYNLELPNLNANYNIGNSVKVYLNKKGLDILMKLNQLLVADCFSCGIKPICIPLAEDCSITMPMKDIMKIFGIYISYLNNKVTIPFDLNVEIAKEDLEPIKKRQLKNK